MERKITIEVETAVQWIATRTPSGIWVVACDALGLTVEGKSQEEVPGLIKEALELLLLDLFEDNELDEFLRAQGWQAIGSSSIAPGEKPEFEIPWEILPTFGSSYGATQ